MGDVRSFTDLRVYQELKQLHLTVHEESLKFPKLELYELGSQVRRSSNSGPANVAEGWGSRHTNIYMEAINRAMGEVHETQHHLAVAMEKGYITDSRFQELNTRYAACCGMLERLYQSLSKWRGSTRTNQVREERASYIVEPDLPHWQDSLPDDAWVAPL